MSRALDDDEPMTLAEACEVVFRGTIKPATLRAEAARGNLVIERIGRRDFVTRSALREMRTKCRVQQKEPASGTTAKPGTGLSETERSNVALAAALRSARGLRLNSENTSSKSTSRQATIVRLGS